MTNQTICATSAALLSRMTSRKVPVLEGRKVWCHSSNEATRAVLKNATAAHCKHQRVLKRGNVARQDRNSSTLRMKYPTTCPALRINACQTAKRAGSKPNRNEKMGYRRLAVWSEDPMFVDSSAMIASQMADGNQTLMTRLVDVFKRQF